MPGDPRMSGSAVFHRDFGADYPLIVNAQGSYLYANDGTEYLDGSSGAVAANLGHGVTEIADAMREQALRVGFAHTLRFETAALHDAAARIQGLAPEGFTRVFFASGGSEANESAFKLARQYHLSRGESSRHLVVGMWDNYHGNTLGALAVGGDASRRQHYAPMLPRTLRLPSWRDSADAMAPVAALEKLVRSEGAENISALILEPLVGSQLGAFEPEHEALRKIAEICRTHGIVLIADEVMTGFGRCGRNFAVERSGIVPDLITFGKGVTGGYAPLSGVIVSEPIVQAVRDSGGVFHHGYTYSGHPVAVAAAAAALQFYAERDVLKNVALRGAELRAGLETLAARYPSAVTEVRGAGLLLALELSPALTARSGANALNREAMARGLVLYPGASTRADSRGNTTVVPHLLVAPPLTVTPAEIAELLSRLDGALRAHTN